MELVNSLMSFRGRWIPSKMLPMIPEENLIIGAHTSRLCSPGPSSTDRGLPVLRTGSPTVTPDVSSYTCALDQL